MQKAPSVFDIMARVAEIRQIVNTPSSQVYMMTFDNCEEIAELAKPGQFVLIWPEPESILHILGRPFCIAFSHHSKGQIEIIFKVVGWGTNELAQKKPGDLLKIRGPLGNGWQINSDVTDVLLVAGGTGIAALTGLIDACRQSDNIRTVHIFIGARTADELVLPTKIAKFRHIDLYLATEDGSEGFHGLVTDALKALLYNNPLQEPQIFAAGPRPMLKAVAEIARQNGIPGQVSMESQMACGVGACMGCATAVYDQESPMGWTYGRVCKDGPVFPIGKIVWRWEKMRMKMAKKTNMELFIELVKNITGCTVKYDEASRVVTIEHSSLISEEKILKALHEKSGLMKEDYTLLPDKN